MGMDLRSSTTLTQEDLLAYILWQYEDSQGKGGEMLPVFIRTYVAELFRPL